MVNNMRICNDIKEQQELRKTYSKAGYKYERTSRTRHRKGKYEYDKCIEMWWDSVNEEWKYIYYKENKKEVE